MRRQVMKFVLFCPSSSTCSRDLIAASCTDGNVRSKQSHFFKAFTFSSKSTLLDVLEQREARQVGAARDG